MVRFWVMISGLVFAFAASAYAQDKSSFDIKLTKIESNIAENAELGQLLEQCPVDYYNGLNVDYTISGNPCMTDPETCFNKCVKGDANSCFDLGFSIQQQVSKSNELTERLYAKSCQLGMPLACTNRSAGMLSDGIDSDEGKTCVARSFEMTCDLNDQWGCQMYSLVLWNGYGVDKNAELARKIIDKTCRIDPDHTPCDYAKSILAEINRENEIPAP